MLQRSGKGERWRPQGHVINEFPKKRYKYGNQEEEKPVSGDFIAQKKKRDCKSAGGKRKEKASTNCTGEGLQMAEGRCRTTRPI